MITIEEQNFNSFKVGFSVSMEEIKQMAVGKGKSYQGSYVCEYCDRLFLRKDRLDRHKFSHTGIVSNVPIKRLKTNKGINRGFPTHFQKNHKCHYGGCDKAYTCDSHLRRHIRASHELKTKIGSYKCKDGKCGQEFTSLSNMHRHFRDQHYSPVYFPCTECELSFRRKFKLNSHMIIVHNIGSYKYNCPTCEKGFFNRPSYLKHIRIHEEKPIRSCDNCELTFTKWTDLVKHRREAHKRILIGRFSCDLCPRTFKWLKSLRVHMNVHLVKKTKIFHCPKESCAKSYSTKSNLKQHIRSKHEGKNFKCPVCASTLTTKQRYQQHLNTHLGVKTEQNLKESCLSHLTGVEVSVEVTENLELPYEMIVPIPSKIELPTESEISDY